MFIDNNLSFSSQQALSGNSETASTNVFDAGLNAAGNPKKAFAGSGEPLTLVVTVPAMTGTNPTFRARLVGADDSALTSNVETIADTGTTRVLTAADFPLVFELTPALQKTAKRYYGVMYTLGGTTPAGAVTAAMAVDSQCAGIK